MAALARGRVVAKRKELAQIARKLTLLPKVAKEDKELSARLKELSSDREIATDTLRMYASLSGTTGPLGELADEVAQAMKHREAQRHGFFTRGVSLAEPLSRAAARPRATAGAPFSPGAYVRVRAGEAQRFARVREAGGLPSSPGHA